MDEDSKNYIINYLKNYKGTVLVISHDIEFLDQVTTKTLFIDKRNNHKGLFCGECGKWQKWLGKDEYNLVKRFIESKKI